MKDIHQIIEQCIHLPQECNTQEQIILEKIYVLQGAVIEILNRPILVGLQFYIEYFFLQSSTEESLVSEGNSIDDNKRFQLIVKVAVDEVLKNHPRIKKWTVIPQDKRVFIFIEE